MASTGAPGENGNVRAKTMNIQENLEHAKTTMNVWPVIATSGHQMAISCPSNCDATK